VNTRNRRGERLFAAGERAVGIFVVLKRTLTMSLRDGFGRVVPVVRHGPGQFTGEIAQLSGGFALVDADADEDVEVLLIQPDRIRALIVADAELGERIVRAMMLRRVAQIESGRSGAVLIGELQSPHMLSGPQIVLRLTQRLAATCMYSNANPRLRSGKNW
jgi:thioredoxin reductase (NADPH)